MASIVVSGDTSGAVTLSAPSVAGTTTVTLPSSTGTMALLQTPSFATTIGVGGTTASASGAGISFPAAQSPSSDANTLDDYEEGTWTPVVYIGTTSQSVTTATGTYTKIGNVVFFAMRAEGVTKSGTGNLTVQNLPFTPNISGNQNKYAQMMVRFTGISSGGQVQALVDGASTILVFQNISATGYSGGTNDTQISASYNLYGVSGFYYTS